MSSSPSLYWTSLYIHYLINILHSIFSNEYFRSESSVTGATDVDVTGETEDPVIVTTSLPQQDVILTLQDSSDQIKPQNIEKAVFILIHIARSQGGSYFSVNTKQATQIKTATLQCDKCLKLTFRYRHTGFCGKCVKNNYIDPKEQDQLSQAQHCSKCGKTKFRARYQLFCATNCPSEEEDQPVEATEVPYNAEPEYTYRGRGFQQKFVR